MMSLRYPQAQITGCRNRCSGTHNLLW